MERRPPVPLPFCDILLQPCLPHSESERYGQGDGFQKLLTVIKGWRFNQKNKASVPDMPLFNDDCAFQGAGPASLTLKGTDDLRATNLLSFLSSG